MANTSVEVFELNKNLESSLFDGFDFADNARSFLGKELPDDDFEHENAAKLSWQPVSLAKKWKPQKVVGTVRPFNDYPCIGLGRDVPIFSKRAVNALRDVLEANGELLPLIAKQGEYFAYNLLTKSDALNVSRSSVEFVPESAKETAFGIDYFEFHPRKVTKHAIFRLREYPTAIYVTSRFKDRVEQAALNGFHFVKVWPYPPGVNWEMEEIKRSKKARSGKPSLQGESLIVTLSTKRAMPTAGDRRRAEQITQDIEVLLSDQRRIDDPYIGATEFVEPAKGGMQIGLSCPDVEKLVAFVRTTLEKLEWDGEITVTKRYGNLFSARARQKQLMIGIKADRVDS